LKDEEYVRLKCGHSYCLDCAGVGLETCLNIYDEESEQNNKYMEEKEEDEKEGEGEGEREEKKEIKTIIYCGDIKINGKKENISSS
jgi:hypothetical protein